MNLKQIVGLVLLAIGVLMVIFAVHSMRTMTHAEELARKVSSHKEMVYMVGGIVLVLIGIGASFLFRGKKR